MKKKARNYVKQDMSPEERFEKYCKNTAEKLIKQIEAGTAPWQRGWKTAASFAPRNGSTNRCYNGMNIIVLTMAATEAGYEDPRWLTYKQAQAMGAQVKKGEKGIQICRPIYEKEVIKRDENGKPVLGEDGKPVKVKEKLEKPYRVYHTVFNAQQIENMPPLPEREKVPEWEINARAEGILQQSGAKIIHKPSNEAFYSSQNDTIVLPNKGQFQTEAGYYATALHELGHWTSHPSRLDRKLGNKFGSEDYAKEELRAEIASFMVCSTIGIESPVENHASYVDSWVKVLKNDPKEIYNACRDAGKIQEFVLAFDKTLTLDQQQELQDEEVLELQPEELQAVEREIQEQRAEQTPKVTPEQEKAPQDTPTQQEAEEALSKVETPTVQQSKIAEKKTYLALPWEEKDAGKKFGARWDNKAKLWYAPEGTDLKPLEKWLPKLSPRASVDMEEARSSLRGSIEKMGGIVPAGHPRMDFHKFHRIPTESAPRGTDFAYSLTEGHDGKPLAYLQNWKTGEKKVVVLGTTITKEMSLSDRAATQQQKDKDFEELTKKYEQTAEDVQKRFSSLEPVTKTTAYMTRKDIEVSQVSPGGIKKDDKYDALVVPAYDLDGKQWTSQTIYDSGEKRFAKDSKKLGCCYVFAGKDCGNPKHLKEANNIIICEGFATASSLFKAAPNGTAVVVAFDAGNMETVAKDIAKRYPQTPKLIAADDDYAKTLTGAKNVGREKGEQIAKEIGAVCIVPAFKPEQRNFPADVPKFTPEDWSKGLISTEQRKAYENIKSFSDFNDLERVDKQSLAWQVGRGLSDAITKQTERNIRQQQTQERQKTQSQGPDNDKPRGRGR